MAGQVGGGPAGLGLLRAQLLDALEACERGLAQAYRLQARRARGVAAEERRALEREAERHLRHGNLLRRLRSDAGGAGRAEEPIDRLWVSGPPADPVTLARAEQRAHDALHDCLSDLDGRGCELVRSMILPEHVGSLRRACARADLDENEAGSLDVPAP